MLSVILFCHVVFKQVNVGVIPSIQDPPPKKKKPNPLLSSKLESICLGPPNAMVTLRPSPWLLSSVVCHSRWSRKCQMPLLVSLGDVPSAGSEGCLLLLCALGVLQGFGSVGLERGGCWWNGPCHNDWFLVSEHPLANCNLSGGMCVSVCQVSREGRFSSVSFFFSSRRLALFSFVGLFPVRETWSQRVLEECGRACVEKLASVLYATQKPVQPPPQPPPLSPHTHTPPPLLPPHTILSCHNNTEHIPLQITQHIVETVVLQGQFDEFISFYILCPSLINCSSTLGLEKGSPRAIQ